MSPTGVQAVLPHLENVIFAPVYESTVRGSWDPQAAPNPAPLNRTQYDEYRHWQHSLLWGTKVWRITGKEREASGCGEGRNNSPRPVKSPRPRPDSVIDSSHPHTPPTPLLRCAARPSPHNLLIITEQEILFPVSPCQLSIPPAPFSHPPLPRDSLCRAAYTPAAALSSLSLRHQDCLSDDDVLHSKRS